jgi:hypothetical protein
MKRSASQFDMGAKAQHHPKSSWGDFAPLALLMFFSFFKKKEEEKPNGMLFKIQSRWESPMVYDELCQANPKLCLIVSIFL